MASADTESVEASETSETPVTDAPARFGTFGGVFTPTVLTILGVIMYLRLGWVVGNAGLLGGLCIIVLGFAITAATGLAMSSLTTNISIGAGGAYAIIAQSLGLEVGGALGIPRYISQALAVTMYIFGFREGWLYIFPDHPAIAVDLTLFGVLFVIAFVSARFAIRVQYLIMAIIVGSLVSCAVAAFQGSMQYSLDSVALWGSFEGVAREMDQSSKFWHVFAVFFPATTGIMAGANMSGELEAPKRSITVGTMAAIGVSLVVYLALGYWIMRSATNEELVSNYYVMIDKAAWGPAVIAGLLGACFSSALASLVGSARILQAMGDHGVVPKSDWFAQISRDGEPRNAMWVTGAMILLSLLLRNLNAVAPMITMFFLVTYAMLNIAVIIEQSLGMVSFRPFFKISRLVSGFGLVGSTFAMFILSPTISLISVGIVVAFYVYLTNDESRIDTSVEDVRSGMFFSLASWAANHTNELSSGQERAWSPDLLIPLQDPATLRGDYTLVEGITHPQGSVELLGHAEEPYDDEFEREIHALAESFRERDNFATSTIVTAVGYREAVLTGLQMLAGQYFFRPNILFLHMPETAQQEEMYWEFIEQTDEMDMGSMVYNPHPRAGLGERNCINVWIPDQSPRWELGWDVGNLDLCLLAGYKLKENWDANLRLVTVVEEEFQKEPALEFLDGVSYRARFPETELHVAVGSFRDYLYDAPYADINIFGLIEATSFDFMREAQDTLETSCLSVRGSGSENVFA